MKKVLSIIFVLVIILSVPMSALAAGNGFDEYGYNDNGNIFNGTGSSWCQGKLGWNEQTCDTYMAPYQNDQLIMKWSEEWNRGNADNWAHPPYNGAWTSNEWNGAFSGGSGEVWHYKIIWVGPTKWNPTGQWSLNFVYGGNYPHTMNIDYFDYATGNFSGTGFYNSDSSYTWTVTGNTSGTNISFHILYTGTNAGYYVDVYGVISADGTILGGTWYNNYQSGTWTGSGIAVKDRGPYWRNGGYLIWGQFEVVMDHGMSDGAHHWFTHALPTGYGVINP